MFMPATMLLTVTTTGTSTYTRAQDPYCYFGEPLWKQPPADSLADALNAAGVAGDLLPESAKTAARAVLNLRSRHRIRASAVLPSSSPHAGAATAPHPGRAA